MAVPRKKSKIASRIKKEVANENAKLKKIQLTTGRVATVSGDLGCSDSGGCSNYCSES